MEAAVVARTSSRGVRRRNVRDDVAIDGRSVVRHTREVHNNESRSEEQGIKINGRKELAYFSPNFELYSPLSLSEENICYDKNHHSSVYMNDMKKSFDCVYHYV